MKSSSGLFLVLGLLFAGGCARTSGPAAELRWGGDAEGGAPFVEADPADPGKVRGFDVEIAELIAKGLGRRARFVQVGWSSIEPSVERGDFDIGLSGVEDSPVRRAEHALTFPYYEFREVLAVRPADRNRFRRLPDLAGKRVGTLGGTAAYQILLEERDRSRLIPVSYDDDVHPYADLAAGRLDAVLLDNIIAERSLRRTGGFVIQPEAVAVGHYVGVLAKANTALRDSVNAILAAAAKDGSLNEIFARWLTSPPTPLAVLTSPPAGVVPSGARERGVGGEVKAGGAGAYLGTLLRAAGITLVLSCFSMAFAIAVGILVSTGRVYGSKLLRALLTGYVEVVRGTPLLLQLFVIYYGLSGVVRLPAFLAAVLGLGLNYAAYESEIYRAALEAIPRSQLEAARTLGLSELQVLKLVRIPQALRLALAPMTNDFVALLKDSSLVSVITVVELTKQTAIYATNAGSWVVPGLICGAIYLALSLPLSRLARRLERRWSLA